MVGSLPTRRDLARTAGFQPNSSSSGRISASRLEFGGSVLDCCSFGRNPANPDSDETIRIPAFISDSGYSSRNLVKVAEILLVSDRISSPVIFILFYINIYMF
jgi:hypothetical protein